MGNLRWDHTKPYELFRWVHTEPPMHFRKANTQPSVHFRRDNKEYLCGKILGKNLHLSVSPLHHLQTNSGKNFWVNPVGSVPCTFQRF